MEWCNYPVIQHQRYVLGPGKVSLQDWRRVRDGTHRIGYWCWTRCAPPHLRLREYTLFMLFPILVLQEANHNLDSSFPRSEASISRTISISPSSSNTLATSHTTSLKPALSGASLLLDSSRSFISETTSLAFSGIIRTWSLVPLTVPVSQCFSSFLLQSLGLVALRFPSLHGGVTMLTASTISALWPSRARQSWTLLTSSLMDLLSMLQRLKTLIFLT